MWRLLVPLQEAIESAQKAASAKQATSAYALCEYFHVLCKEVIGGRAGKSGGAAIQSIPLMGFGGATTLSSLAPVLGGVVIIVVIAWCISVSGLSKKFSALTKSKEGKAA